ncbi:lytic transglycosylase domain-containing protein, partial [Stenotrophomonas maltophilia]
YKRALLRRYNGDRPLEAAAYNACFGAVTRYKGVPPYADTLAYVDKVMALNARYRAAMGIRTEVPAR